MKRPVTAPLRDQSPGGLHPKGRPSDFRSPRGGSSGDGSRGDRSSGDRLLRRRRLLWWSALPVLLLLCLAAKLLSVGALGGQASRAFDAGDSGAVADAAAALRIANFTEPHKAPFAAGDGSFLAGDFAGARRSFEEALLLAGRTDECAIRVNLALSIERLGDHQAAAEDPGSAAALYAEGLAVVKAAPDGCFDSAAEAASRADAASAAGAADKLKQAEERLTRKSAEAAAGAAPPGAAKSPGEADPPADAGHQSQLDQLSDRGRQARSERNSGQERDEYLRDTDFGSGPDRPW